MVVVVVVVVIVVVLTVVIVCNRSKLCINLSSHGMVV